MDRRKSLKAIALGTLSAGVLLEGCKLSDKDKEATVVPAKDKNELNLDRAKEELERDRALMSKKFFNEHEMATITVLADIIIPADEVSKNASAAGVPAFIDFIVQDMPSHQTPMQGGLRWLDMECFKRFQKSFVDCSESERILVVDDIAYPMKAKPEMKPGVAFFNLMRNLTVTGFYTSEIGVKDLDYKGNAPNKWNGVPKEVLDQYKLAYSEWEEKNCAKYE
jgi:gluconate 2-dehydrogenase gamma chain